MITAKEAIKLSNTPTLEDALATLEVLIVTAAKKGKRKIRVPYGLVNIDGYSCEFKAQGVSDELEKLGYLVEYRYEESQFVDIYLEVCW